MDLDPLRRRIVTRILGVLDMILGLFAFIFQMYLMWDFYLFVKDPNGLEISKTRLYLFGIMSIIILSVKLFQICMGFGLVVATFGRNLEESIRISKWWLVASIFLILLILIKLIFMSLWSSLIAPSYPFDTSRYIFGVIELFFRLFATYWVTKFINFLNWQNEFDSACPRPVRW